MCYDQDFINDGYADGKFLRVPIQCPTCFKRATTILQSPPVVRNCFNCGTPMVQHEREPKSEWLLKRIPALEKLIAKTKGKATKRHLQYELADLKTLKRER